MKKSIPLSIFCIVFVYQQLLASELNFQQSGTTKMLYKVCFINQNSGWILGETGTLLSTIDGGENWISENTDESLTFSDIFFIDANTGWIVGGYNGFFYEPKNGFIRQTHDGGQTWDETAFDNSLSGIGAIFFIDENTGWGTEGYNYFNSNSVNRIRNVNYTTDGGKTWVLQFSESFENVWTSDKIEITSETFHDLFFLDEHTGWLSGCNGAAYKTIDSGTNWEICYHDKYLDNHWWGMHFTDVQNGFFATRKGLLRTMDAGSSWDYVLSGESIYSFEAVQFCNKNIGAAVGTSISMTKDGGFTWKSIIDKESAENWNQLWDVCIVDAINAWAVGDGGTIIKFLPDETTAIHERPGDTTLPDHIGLYQNYPNPFNPATTIQFVLNRPEFVTLNIYNLAGQHIETLLRGHLTAGEHDAIWQSDGLPSGIYIARLQTTDEVKMIKLALQK
ncbi:T9SS type A sorting domain-containing protein [candidate division KSB1 bacterium]|nr:T9SS type A sorting domain-containing protein [candidate division KSB1 bacterium]